MGPHRHLRGAADHALAPHRGIERQTAWRCIVLVGGLELAGIRTEAIPLKALDATGVRDSARGRMER